MKQSLSPSVTQEKKLPDTLYRVSDRTTGRIYLVTVDRNEVEKMIKENARFMALCTDAFQFGIFYEDDFCGRIPLVYHITDEPLYTA